MRQKIEVLTIRRDIPPWISRRLRLLGYTRRIGSGIAWRALCRDGGVVPLSILLLLLLLPIVHVLRRCTEIIQELLCLLSVEVHASGVPRLVVRRRIWVGVAGCRPQRQSGLQ